MFIRSFLCLVIASSLMFAGCRIEGRVVDRNGEGLAGVTVTLSGSGLYKTTSTNNDGFYHLGDLMNYDIIPAGNYTITPSCSGCTFTAETKNVTIVTQTLGELNNVPWPVNGVDFEARCISSFAGVYRLIAFTIIYDAGMTLTQDNFNSYSGTMTVTSDGKMFQDVTIMTVSMSVEADILSFVDNDTVQISSEGCTYNLDFELNGNILTTTIPSGAICGTNNFTEIDVWEKLSSYSRSGTKEILKEDDIFKGFLGGAIGDIME